MKKKKQEKKSIKDFIFLLMASFVAIYTITHQGSDLFIQLGILGGIIFLVHFCLQEGDWI